jgi:protein subunit release factor B
LTKGREHVLSVTLRDCRVDTFRGTGKGGQKRNKTESAVRISHEPSGAVGVSDATRSQHQNRRDAFLKMVRSPHFQKWLRIETARRIGKLDNIDAVVDDAMQPTNLLVEGRENGKWSLLA